MEDDKQTHSSTKRLYRAAEKYPPRDGAYRTDAEKSRPIPPGASDEFIRSRDALSAWDTSEAAMIVALSSRSACYVVAYDIPENCGMTYEPSLEPGHFSIRGDMEELKAYLSDVKVDVKRGEKR